MKTKQYTVIAAFDDEPANVHSLHVEGLDPYEARRFAQERMVLEAYDYESEEEANAKDPDFSMDDQCEGITILYTFPGHIHDEQ